MELLGIQEEGGASVLTSVGLSNCSYSSVLTGWILGILYTLGFQLEP